MPEGYVIFKRHQKSWNQFKESYVFADSEKAAIEKAASSEGDYLAISTDEIKSRQKPVVMEAKIR